MAFEALTAAPAGTDFVPLNEHETQTPNTFFGGKPVLHLSTTGASLKTAADQLEAQPELKALASNPRPASDADGEACLENIDIWVTSRNLLLWSSAQSTGLSIPYPTITVTAQDGTSVLLELNLSDPDTADEDIQFLQIRLNPPTTSTDTTSTNTATTTTQNGHSPSSPSTALYQAISACQDLNPDPPGTYDSDDGMYDDDADDYERGLDPTAPGATGWITSENMADYVDEEGNFRMPGHTHEDGDRDGGEVGGLGPGAGRTRTAAEVDGDIEGNGNGYGVGGEEVGEEETKWRRTE